MSNDGSIRVAVKLDTTNVPGDLKEMEADINKTAQKIEKIANSSFSIDLTNGDSFNQAVDKAKQSAVDLQKTLNTPTENGMLISTEKQLAKAQARLAELQKAYTNAQAETDKMLVDASDGNQVQVLLDIEEKELKDIENEMNEINQAVDRYIEKWRQANAEKEAKATAKQERMNVASANAEIKSTAPDTSFINKISSFKKYEEVVNQTKLRLAELEQAAIRAAEDKGIDVTSVLEANNEYQKLTAQLKALESEQTKINIASRDSDLKLAENAKNESKIIKEINSGIKNTSPDMSFVDKISDLRKYNLVIEQTKARLAELEKAAEQAAVSKGVDTSSVLNANKEYQKLQARLKALTSEEVKHKIAAKSAFSTAKKEAAGFGDSIKGCIKHMAKYTLAIFGARSAFMAVKSVMQEYINSNEELADTVNNMKGAMAEFIGPVVEWVVDKLRYALAYVNEFVKALTGVDFVARYNEKRLKKQAKAINENTKAQKEYNKEIRASFDTFERLNASEQAQSNLSKDIEDDISLLKLPDVSNTAFGQFAEKVKENLVKIIAGSGFALLALGTILVITGVNIPLGLALLIAGAALSYKAAKTAWGQMTPDVQNELASLMKIFAVALVALGAILLFLGQYGWGVGLIIAGVMAGEVGKIMKASIGGEIDTVGIEGLLGELIEKASDCLVALGILALVGQQYPLGIKLIIAGVMAGEIAYQKYGASDSIVGFVHQLLNSITGIFTGFCDTWWSCFNKRGIDKINSMKNGIIKMFQSVADWIAKILNWAVKGFSDVNKGAKSLQTPSANRPKSTMSARPKMAVGGIVNNPGRGVDITAGEAGREAILPLDRNTQWMDTLADKLASRISGGGDTPIIINANGSMAQLIRMLRLEIERDKRNATAWR